MIERIGEFIENQGISIRSFEQKISASNGLIRKALTNKTDIQSKWLSIIVDNYPQINPEWLLTGQGEMLRESSFIESDNWIKWSKKSHQSNYRLEKSGLRLSEIAAQKKLELFELKNLIEEGDDFYKMVSGEIPVSEIVFDKIYDIYPDIREKWLYTGHGDMFSPITESVQQPTTHQQENNIISLLKEQLKEERLKIEKQAQEIGKLKERLSVFMAGSEQIEGVEDVDVAAVG